MYAESNLARQKELINDVWWRMMIFKLLTLEREFVFEALFNECSGRIDQCKHRVFGAEK